MAREIERKYLLKNDDWRNEVKAQKHYHQGYLNTIETCSVRVRIEGEQAKINVKSAEYGISRDEYEYDIPMADAEKMLATLCIGPTLEKTRYFIERDGLTWEIDEFSGDNQGLIVAEVELTSETQTFDKPTWLGEEVTEDIRYYNVNLIKKPYKSW